MKMNGPEKSAKELADMDEEEIQTLGNYMSTLGEIDIPIMDSVNRDFYNLVETDSSKVNAGGMDFLEYVLMKAIDPVKATQILKNITSPGEEMSGGLETVRLLAPKVIASFIRKEHPQTAAIILAHLDGNAASQTLRELPEAQRMEIVHRLATLERVSPRVIRDLDNALKKEFKSLQRCRERNWAVSKWRQNLWRLWTERRKRIYWLLWRKWTQVWLMKFVT